MVWTQIVPFEEKPWLCVWFALQISDSELVGRFSVEKSGDLAGATEGRLGNAFVLYNRGKLVTRPTTENVYICKCRNDRIAVLGVDKVVASLAAKSVWRAFTYVHSFCDRFDPFFD